MGFPSPAADYVETRLSLDEVLIQKPAATYYMRAGETIYRCGIMKDALLVIDSSLKPCDGSLLICDCNGEFKVKRYRTYRQLRPNLLREVIIWVFLQPAPHGHPFRGFVPVPAFLVSQHHFNQVIALLIERRNQTGQSEKVCNRRDAAGLGCLLRRGYLTPVRFAYEHYSPGLEAFCQQIHCPGYAPPQSRLRQRRPPRHIFHSRRSRPRRYE